jgi:hypothetical protein
MGVETEAPIARKSSAENTDRLAVTDLQDLGAGMLCSCIGVLFVIANHKAGNLIFDL